MEIEFLWIFLGVIVVFSFSYILLKKINAFKARSILEEAKNKADQIKKEKILQAKERFLELKSKHEQAINSKNLIIQKSQERIKQKEQGVNKKIEFLSRKEKEGENLRNQLSKQRDLLVKKEEDLDKIQKKRVAQLESISKLSAEDAKNTLIESFLFEYILSP